MSAGELTAVAGLLVLVCIVQPILLGICSRKIYRRTGVFSGILAVAMNIGMLVFFEKRVSALGLIDIAAEFGTVAGLSAILILAALEVLRKGPPATPAGTFPINLRRGLFRAWVLLSGPWIVFCAIEFWNCAPYRCYIFLPFGKIPFQSYFDVATWFIGFPILAFVIFKAVCWVVEGFGRSLPPSSSESAQGGSDLAESRVAGEASELSTRSSAVT